ncbi:MAG: DUF1573 domain-containing protein [Thermoguttaceae bacterium]
MKTDRDRHKTDSSSLILSELQKRGSILSNVSIRNLDMLTQVLKSYYRSLLTVCIAAFLVLGGTSAVFSQNWAESLFKVKSHNFGKVALQSNTEYRFVFQNTLKSDIQIASVSSSCSCTSPSYSKKVIKSMETGEIIAKVNTSGQHQGKRSATITVRFDRPSEAYVQLEVAVYIRPDVVLSPGTVDFGTVQEGKSISKTVQVQYAGNPSWKIQKIETSTPYLAYRAVPDESSKNPGEVTYNVTVTLSSNTPPGYFRDNLRFITNEGSLNERGEKSNSVIELPVNAAILDNLVAKPSPFQFGMVSPDEVVTKYLVLRGTQPFKVKKVSTNDPQFQFSVPQESSSVQIIAVTLTPRKNTQEGSRSLSQRIKVETDIQDQDPIWVEVHARLLDEETAHFNQYFADPATSRNTSAQQSVSFSTVENMTVLESAEPVFTVRLESSPIQMESVAIIDEVTQSPITSNQSNDALKPNQTESNSGSKSGLDSETNLGTISKKNKSKSKTKKETPVTKPPEYMLDEVEIVRQHPSLPNQDSNNTAKQGLDHSAQKIVMQELDTKVEPLTPPRVRFGVPKTSAEQELVQNFSQKAESKSVLTLSQNSLKEGTESTDQTADTSQESSQKTGQKPVALKKQQPLLSTVPELELTPESDDRLSSPAKSEEIKLERLDPVQKKKSRTPTLAPKELPLTESLPQEEMSKEIGRLDLGMFPIVEPVAANSPTSPQMILNNTPMKNAKTGQKGQSLSVAKEKKSTPTPLLLQE